ncbi:MAG TPA: Crp/Fnr family transcriptional regulator [Eubacteriaceae bacterium]|nr:Crp/Fnr family transcriptional regulator [Eubacteriaceae bacterium]
MKDSISEDFIQRVPLLKAIGKTQVLRLLKDNMFSLKTIPRKSILHLEGDQCDYLEVIVEGQVVIDRLDQEGDLWNITHFSKGDLLGGNILFSHYPHYPMTVSCTDNTLLLLAHKDQVFNLCKENEKFLQAFLQAISDNAFILGDKIKKYVKTSLRDRIIDYIHRESNRQQSDRIQLFASKKAIAEKLGVERTSLSRELQKMKKEGLIDYDRFSITKIGI